MRSAKVSLAWLAWLFRVRTMGRCDFCRRLLAPYPGPPAGYYILEDCFWCADCYRELTEKP